MLVFINVIIFFCHACTIQFIINIKLHTPDVFKQSDTIPRRAQYNINIHAIKRIYLPLISQDLVLYTIA
jgi:hypothetical protein